MNLSRVIPCIVFVALLSGCEQAKAPAPSAPVEPEVPAREITPHELASKTEAKLWIWRAQRTAFAKTMERARSTTQRLQAEERVERPSFEGARAITVMFSSNNHGEREDCGCKHNPLGGLDRRATMIELVEDPSDKLAEAYWGKQLEQPEVLLHVDAGDAFYKNEMVDRSKPALQDRARHEARAVAAVMKQLQIDAVNVGERDLVFGVEDLKLLGAKLPLISANLLDAKTRRPIFPGHVIIERGGARVAVIGALKERPRGADYYKSRGVEVAPVIDAVEAQVKALPEDVDLIIVLDNEGVPLGQKLAKVARERGVRIDAVIASNSNRLTHVPEWSAGTPVVEPMSRGKYFGRLDFWIQGEGAPSYKNDTPDRLLRLNKHRRAWTNYAQARISALMIEAQIHKTSIELADAALSPELREEKTKHVTRLTQQLEQRYARAGVMAADAASIVAASDVPEKSAGDDWVEARIMPVKLAIPQEPVVRKMLDKWAKSTPETK